MASLLLTPASADETKASVVIPAFNASYTIIHKSKSVGTATRHLSYVEDNIADYSYSTDIEWLIFSDSRRETSRVSINGHKVTPMEYQFVRKGTGRDKSYHWRYDTANGIATNQKKHKQLSVDFPDNIQDKLSYHLQNRFNLISNPEQKHFVYPVISTSGKIKNYVYQYDGEEEIMLPYGLVKTIKLKREVIEKKRVTYAWFAPELDYLLVKLYQVKSGVEQFEAQLKSLEISKDYSVKSPEKPIENTTEEAKH
jgi:hypothetical protein